MIDKHSAQKRIKKAATQIFTKKGLTGARMQDIADAAKVNKAMLHYYFRNKQLLFEEIFEDKLQELFGSLTKIISSDLPFEEKIRAFVKSEIEIISEFPTMPLFLLNEINQNPGILTQKLRNKPIDQIIAHLKNLYVKEIEEKKVRDLPFEQFIIDLISLCIYPLIAKPLFMKVLNLPKKKYEMMITERKTLVAEMVLNNIKLDQAQVQNKTP